MTHRRRAHRVELAGHDLFDPRDLGLGEVPRPAGLRQRGQLARAR